MLWPAGVFCQGPINPVGTPGPTMKTLDQVEARTPIAASMTTVTISADGSYYLTGNVSVPTGNGITVTAANVTLDLNGFTISSTSASGFDIGIAASNVSNLVIRNGLIRGTTTYNSAIGAFTAGGFSYGIDVANANDVRIENVSVSRVANTGIRTTSANTTVSHCQTDVTPVGGINAARPTSSVDHCVATLSGGFGVSGGSVADCHGTTTANGDGVSGSTVANCYGVSVSGTGISGTTITNCQGTSTSGTGVNGASVVGCSGTSGSSNGIQATNVASSSGTTTTGTGVNGTNSATNCTGTAATSGTGVYASSVSNCYGYALTAGTGISGSVVSASYGASGSGGGNGITAFCVNNCTGYSGGSAATSAAINCSSGVATGCNCLASAPARCLVANIANGCSVGNTTGVVVANYKYNMP